ncbi:DNA-binding response regulator [Marinobacter vulgaris]|uniref:DNA-binding response regulator n=1 Tax=Marinobacter vulgaris TaxID=1928331 RepID=A0A2V3ZMR9_9GAMM|nr:response regulator transcription factor [Marinobacter vulgaris]PXX92392.1 DNA-binding response regulator [Marinobacter vulgaris]TSJ71664.1 response regulator transcription factor [Marinobacter vulgaris]
MKLLIVDDHKLFTDGMRHLLGHLGGANTIEDCTRAKDAILRLEKDDFDLVLIDLAMPGMDGLAILQRLWEMGSVTPVVVVSAEEDISRIDNALALGALGYIPKEQSAVEMLDALHQVLSGEIYIPVKIRERLRGFHARRHPEEGTLTKRQSDVLELVAKGYSNKQIACALFLAEHTVKVHIACIIKALSASNRTECVHKARSLGLLD